MQVTNTIPMAEASEEVRAALVEVHVGKLFAAIARFNEDETKIVLEKRVNFEDGFDKFRETFEEQNVRWALVNVGYETEDGGKRSKMVFITYTPDNLMRSTFKESVRVKSMGVMSAGMVMRECKQVSCRFQANCVEDLDPAELLEKAARFEREAINYNEFYSSEAWKSVGSSRGITASN